MKAFRSGLVALIAVSFLVAGSVGVANAAKPVRTAARGGYGYGPTRPPVCNPGGGYGNKASKKCPPVGTSPEFTLHVTNNSSAFHDFVLYQSTGDASGSAFPLAWMTAPLWPSTTVTFKWTEKYGFVWSQTGPLRPGVNFDTQQYMDADPNDPNSNHTQLDYGNGAFHFVTGGRAPEPGSLSVETTAGVPLDTGALGFGMAGKAVFATQAQPNLTYVFTPHPEYWITAGQYHEGDVLDPDAISSKARVPFQGTNTMNAVLSASNEWTVTSG